MHILATRATLCRAHFVKLAKTTSSYRYDCLKQRFCSSLNSKNQTLSVTSLGPDVRRITFQTTYHYFCYRTQSSCSATGIFIIAQLFCENGKSCTISSEYVTRMSFAQLNDWFPAVCISYEGKRGSSVYLYA